MSNDLKTLNDHKLDCHKKLQALFKLASFFGETGDHGTSTANPRMDRVAAEMRDVLEGTSERLSKLLDDVAGPVWGLLPDDVTDTCRKAGM